MVSRENVFVIGGLVMIALAAALVAGLVWANAGGAAFGGYLASLLSGGFGAFFVYVGRAEAQERRARLRQLSEERTLPAERPR